jgi:hypothetical protein
VFYPTSDGRRRRQQTEAHRLVGRGMMPWRTNRSEAVRRWAADYGIGYCQSGSQGVERYLNTRGRCIRIRI